MDELMKYFRDFIGRDLIYIVSGGQVVGAFLYLFSSVPDASNSWALFTLLGGAGYFIAYSSQEFFSLLRLLPTVAVSKPCRILQGIYRLYLRKKWEEIEIPIDEFESEIIPARKSELERLVLLQQIGTTGGPCLFLCGCILLLSYELHSRYLDLAAGMCGIVFGLLLIIFAWLKAAQRAQFIFKYRSLT